jgi:hypothetical protein
MEEIAIVNRRSGGSLFHYAHFFSDCLYPEVLNEIYKYKKVIRMKNIDQTLGNFSKMYKEIMGNDTVEIPEAEFLSKIKNPTILPGKENYNDLTSINKFRDFIFQRYRINPTDYNPNYPEILLIRRGGRIELLNDPALQKINRNKTTGSERREIKEVQHLEMFLKRRYAHRIKTVYMETQPFEEQIKYFNNAKLIIMAHGAAMSSLIFCKPGITTVMEVGIVNYPWFNNCAKKLDLNHLKIQNDPAIIVEALKLINI